MIFIIFFACSPPFSPVLINLEDWRFGDLSSDPLINHQPDEIACAPNSVQIESEQLEVETDLCNYALVDFPLLQNVPKGAMADFLILHTGLWSEEPATARWKRAKGFGGNNFDIGAAWGQPADQAQGQSPWYLLIAYLFGIISFK